MIVDHADGATLLERVIPGRALTELVVAGSDDQATNILCDVIAALHQPDPPDGGFPHIEDWGRDLERYRHSGDTTIPSAMVDAQAICLRILPPPKVAGGSSTEISTTTMFFTTSAVAGWQ